MRVAKRLSHQITAQVELSSPQLEVRDYNSYVAHLQRCIQLQEFTEAHHLHSNILTHPSLAGDTYLLNLLIQLHGISGNVAHSWQAFQAIHHRNVFSWNIIINAFLRNSHLPEAQHLFEIMPQRDAISSNRMITAYAHVGYLLLAKSLFVEMPQRGPITWNSMIGAYAQSGAYTQTLEMLERMPSHTVIAWTATLAAAPRFELSRVLFQRMHERNDVSWAALAASASDVGEAMNVLQRMPQLNISALSSLIQAYGQENDLQRAWEVFSSMPERNQFSWNILLQSCSQTGDLNKAESLLKMMPCWDVITSNVMITAYGQRGRMEDAWRMFHGMPESSISSWNSILSALVQRKLLEDGRRVFRLMPLHDVISVTVMLGAYEFPEAELLFESIPCRNVFTWNTLLHACSTQAKLVNRAKYLFEKMPARDFVSWNTMIEVFAQAGSGKEATCLVSLMDQEAIGTDNITIGNLLEAISASPLQGKAVVEEILNIVTFLEPPPALVSSLVHALARCGFLEKARSVFCNNLERLQDSAGWSSMISACALNGLELQALEVFYLMMLNGVRPDETVYANLLSACSHAGRVSSGVDVLGLMNEDEAVHLGLDHYVCLIDLLGRAGMINEAGEVIRSMPLEPNLLAWTSFMTSCEVEGDGASAEFAARKISVLHPESGVGYVLLSNMERKHSVYS